MWKPWWQSASLFSSLTKGRKEQQMRTGDQTEERRSVMLWQSALSFHKVICNFLHHKKVCFKKITLDVKFKDSKLEWKELRPNWFSFTWLSAKNAPFTLTLRAKLHQCFPLTLHCLFPPGCPANFMHTLYKFEMKVFFHFLGAHWLTAWEKEKPTLLWWSCTEVHWLHTRKK